MNRRQFLKNMLKAGLISTSVAYADAAYSTAAISYDGPLWIFVNAQGGWDVTSFCDPKGYDAVVGGGNPNRINNYDKADIRQAGNLFYAPPPDDFRSGQLFYDSNLYSAQRFFEKYYQKLLIVNGMDCQTNSHTNGQLFNLSGKMIPGFPAFTALTSSTLAPHLPLSYLTYGGYSDAANLITPVNMNNSSLRALFEVAYANRSSVPRSSISRLYLPTDVEQLITQVSNEKHRAMLATQNLPHIRQSLKNLIRSRQGIDQLQGLADNLELSPSLSIADFNGRPKAYNIYQQGRVALAGYQQGVTSSVNIRLNGFDTHSNHDEKHYPLLMDLLQGVDAILNEANMRGLENNIVLVMVSDFGRTNHFNQQKGKDHWPINSAMVMGNAFQQIRGNRMVGRTTSQHEAYRIDPVTLSADTVGNNSQAISLTPTHLHQSLRQLAGIESAANAVRFGLDGQVLPLF